MTYRNCYTKSSSFNLISKERKVNIKHLNIDYWKLQIKKKRGKNNLKGKLTSTI
jgi:hypothetical protein